MTQLDWIVVGGYLTAMIAMSLWLARGQQDRRDYYLGGNRIGSFAIALSTMATQCSTNSILGAPAFVAFTVGGGLLWLQYELAVPLAMIVIMALLLPTLRHLSLVSVYAYLERRFGLATRLTLSLVFQFVRAFATGVTVYGIGLVLAVCLETSFLTAVILLGVVTVIYDAIGGMRAVIYSDVIQLVVLLAAIIAAIVLALDLLGGWESLFALAPAQRLQALDFAHTGWGDGHDYAFWPMLCGGLFLYVSYYGCDQSQTQRLLSARDVEGGNRALFYNGILRFPLVLAYCLLGLCIAAWAVHDPTFVDRLPTQALTGGGSEPNYNLAVVQFVLEQFSPGFVGLVMVGLFAAAMSSLDSVLNALSATTMEDFVRRLRRSPLPTHAEFILSKVLTVLWGAITVGLAFLVDDIASSILVAINKIGSLINGPLLGVFLLGMLTHRADQRSVLIGLAGGFALNLYLWLFEPGVSWLWWNVTGFLVTFALGVALGRGTPPPDGAEPRFIRDGLGRAWWPSYAMLLLWTALIAGVGLAFTRLA